ncbi:MAG TPA: GNAT family N-acetyltransferase [bacterium]|nr:GNAT family N-acetyltransferase [bacterium]
MPAPEAVIPALREASICDHDFLYDLHIRTMKTYVEQTWGWDEAKAVKMFRERVAQGHYEVIVLNGVDIGAVNCHRRGDTLYVSNIEILPEYQRRGLGTTILQRIIAEAQRDGLTVTLRILKVNPARSLYERLGFIVTREDETHYYMLRA